jgi:hypothetical protein
VKKAIYIYREVFKNKRPKTVSYKTGKADQRIDQSDDITIKEICDIRIKEQLQSSAAVKSHLKFVYAFDISECDSSIDVERVIHSQLENVYSYKRLHRKYEDFEGNTEWFDVDDCLSDDEFVDIVHSIIQKYTKLDTRKTYEPYFYKKVIKLLVISIIRNNRKLGHKYFDILKELAPRFGKTTYMIDLLVELYKEGMYNVCVLPSYWLSSHSSFEKDLKKYSGFDEYIVYVSREDDLDLVMDEWYGKKMIVVEMSLHMENFESKMKRIIELPSSQKISMIDEADYGAWKSNQTEMIYALNCECTMWLSGTGIQKAAVNAKNVYDNIIQFSYTDMLMIKDGTHPWLSYFK